MSDTTPSPSGPSSAAAPAATTAAAPAATSAASPAASPGASPASPTAATSPSTAPSGQLAAAARPPSANAGSAAPEPWTVAGLAERLAAAGLSLRLDEDDSGAYGPQIDFAERSTPEGQPSVSAVEGLTPLVEIGLIRVAGRDAAAFLQGQLTNDIALAGTDHAIYAGLCNPKGRLIATFTLWRGTTLADEEGDAFWLASSRDLAGLLARRLQMFVLRAKVKVSRHDHDRVALGLIGGRALASAGDVLVEHDAPVSRTLVILPEPGKPGGAPVSGSADSAPTAGLQSEPASAASPGLARALVVATLDELPVLARRATQGGLRWVDTRQWRWLEVHAGVPRITAATTEHFVPQMVNFERLGVSFTKGCYPGQEVVARSHYRGTTKRRMFLVAGRGELPPPAGDLDPATGQTEPAGVAVLAARDPAAPGRWALLAEARIEAADAGLGWKGESLETLSLPYPLVDAPAAGGHTTGGRPGHPA